MFIQTLTHAMVPAVQFVSTNGIETAFRRWGVPSDSPPLVLLQRFRGTIDHWDPDLLDRLASTRELIAFDNRGVGRTAGPVATSIAEQARFAAEFISAMDLTVVDVLGFSMGGAVAQTLALDSPDLVRRVVVAGSGPGGVVDGPRPPAKVFEVASRAENTDEDFLYLFFHDSESSISAGRAHLARLRAAADEGAPAVSPEAWKAQLRAIVEWSAGRGAALPRLGHLTKPVLVTNGAHDRMVPAYASYVISQEAPHAKLVLYPDAGHGFLFQYAAEFSQDVASFLG